MAERIAFKGMFPSELEKLTDEQYLGMIKARQRRSIKRKSLAYRKLLEKIEKFKNEKKQKPIRTHTREAVILPSWIGLTFEVHNGKTFQPVSITANMLGHRLGEYAYTTKSVVHSAPGISATKGSKFIGEKK
ncbi:MAG: ribosomal protein S19 family protein [Candidatus Marsarchaeota archaeon]|nr:ribosomal protein S19 family protein [Candidatus Marsarchaeota archaeon]MCL5115287.1 ribosomal protein S19 family protein [Candidatus Marsarchaeota archaeon]